MRKVLMLCYYYPPVQSSGTARSLAFSTLLPEYGWEATVLTVRHPKNRWVATVGEAPTSVKIVRTPEWDLTGLTDLLHGITVRLLRFLGRPPSRNYFAQLLAFPDLQIAWFTTPAGLSLGRDHAAIYASCGPYSSALSALLIGAIRRKPVVVDFRDAWCYDLGRYYAAWYERLLARAEALVVRRCSHLILNTEGARALYAHRYPAQASKMTVIPNGYDRLTPVARVAADKFRIVHVGTFYGGRDPKPLLRALLRIDSPRIEFVHVGEKSDELNAFIPRLRVRQLGILPRDEALQVMQEASLLYLRQGFANTIAVAAKTYEYLATGLPILWHGPEGDNAEMVRRYGVNAVCVMSDDEAELEAGVRAVLDAWPQVTPAIADDFTQRYSRRALTRRLSEVLASVTKRVR
jgi:glycosyltransferase involved in cell wall biosynthesis